MLGDTPDDVEAVVLTHGHFDHLGFAERARTELGVPVWVHENDVPLTRRPRQYGHEQRRVYYFATQFRALPMVAAFVRNRAWWPTPVKDVQRYEREILRVPGALRTSPPRDTRSGTVRSISPIVTPSSPVTRSSR